MDTASTPIPFQSSNGDGSDREGGSDSSGGGSSGRHSGVGQCVTSTIEHVSANN